VDAIDNTKIGFKYRFECYDTDGNLKWEFTEENLIPDAGRDYLLNAGLNAGAQFSTWYIGLYSGNYAPVAGDTAATFPASATEITTAYTGDRHALTPDALLAGVWVNSVAPAIFVFVDATTTVRGGFISTTATKGGTTGLLLSAVLAPSPKTVLAGESLKVTAGLSFITA